MNEPENPNVKVTRNGVRYVTASDVLGSERGEEIVRRTAKARRTMRTPPLSLKKSREVRAEMAAPPEDTPQRRMVLGKAREMQAVRASSGAELVSADLLAFTIAENARLRERMEEHAEQFVRSMRQMRGTAACVSAAIQNMQATMDRDFAPYKARWARKRTPRYLRKGGVRK